MGKPEKFVFVCTNQRPADHPKRSCKDRGAQDVLDRFREVQTELGSTSFRVIPTGCLGPCLSGPTVAVFPDNVWYGRVSASAVGRIVSEHLLGGSPVEELVIGDEEYEASQAFPPPPGG